MSLYKDEEGVVFAYEVRGNEVAIVSLFVLSKKRNVVVPSKIEGLRVTEILSRAFQGKEVECVSLPESITTIYSRAFEGCSLLKEINLPENLSELSFRAFAECTSLESITIPYATNFESEIFDGCTNLKTAKIEHAIYLPSGVFKNCGLEKIYLPDSLTGIDRTVFEGVPKNMKIYGNNDYIKNFATKHGYKCVSDSKLGLFLNEVEKDSENKDINDCC